MSNTAHVGVATARKVRTVWGRLYRQMLRVAQSSRHMAAPLEDTFCCLGRFDVAVHISVFKLLILEPYKATAEDTRGTRNGECTCVLSSQSPQGFSSYVLKALDDRLSKGYKNLLHHNMPELQTLSHTGMAPACQTQPNWCRGRYVVVEIDLPLPVTPPSPTFWLWLGQIA
jgi:hypothetical protein